MKALILCLAAAVGSGLPLQASDRSALVMGNSRYREAGGLPVLENAANDAGLIARALRTAGFEVTFATDLTAAGLRMALEEIPGLSGAGGETVVFFSGHGFGVGKESYALGVDAAVVDGELALESAVPIEEIVEKIAARRPKSALFFFDCCRETLGIRGRPSAVREVLGATYDNYPEMLISYSSEPGGFALEGRELGLENSPYSQALAAGIAGGLELTALMTMVRRDVFRLTGGRQRTWESSSMVEEFYLSSRSFALPGLNGPTTALPVSPDDGTVVAQPGAPTKEWQLLKYKGREYVSVENIARFYQFEEIAKEPGSVWLRHPSLNMRLWADSHEVEINTVLFYTSYPLVSTEDTLLVSTVDLAKLIDPVIRPSYIRKPVESPEFVLLFDETRITRQEAFSTALGQEFAERKVPVKWLISSSEKERTEWLTANSEIDGAIAIYFRLEVPGIPRNGLRALTLAPQGTPPTGGRDSDAVTLPMLASEFDAQNVALATSVYAHLAAYPEDSGLLQLGIGRTLRPEMRAIVCPAMMVETGHLHEGPLTGPAQIAGSIAEAASKFRRAVSRR